ncbi:DNA mismatch repair protein [Trichinella pseudospiralis]|uniref:Uncharacterized protein n=1 Tax=Trichinella pseudospiralis TaxID=6337 RepID=A0A0V0XQ33_TRIPS|nr:hypothetical protein T4E_6459 [Trichinella pseudospiralis]
MHGIGHNWRHRGRVCHKRRRGQIASRNYWTKLAGKNKSNSGRPEADLAAQRSPASPGGGQRRHPKWNQVQAAVRKGVVEQATESLLSSCGLRRRQCRTEDNSTR